MNIKEIIRKHNLFTTFEESSIGLEKEGQRIFSNGVISYTDHPKNIGNRQNHPYIQTDFAESQVELITPPCNNEKEALKYLSAIHEVFLRKINDDEYILPLSIPPILPEKDKIRVAQFDKIEDVQYREYLVDVYGKYKQMVSGIHYNFGFSQNFINELIEKTNIDEVTVRNELYMKLARQFIRYQWLLIYLLGASPIAPDEYFEKIEKPKLPVRSLRTSKYGYVNEENIVVSFNSIEDYAKSLRHYVDTNQLIAEKEFYSSVRFRGASSALDLVHKGIKYLEFRLFDINPLAEFGITEKDTRFIHLFAMLLVWLDETNPENSVKIGKEYSENISLDNPLNKPQYFDEGKFLLSSLLNLLEEANFDEDDKNIVLEKLKQLENPELTVCGKLWKEYEKTNNINDIATNLAIKYKENALEKYYSLRAFNKMELSTQALISDAIAHGISVEIIDEHDQFLKLSYRNHIEYVKNGNMTSHDTYISPLIMENKVVTKKVLAEKNFRVPISSQYTNAKDALKNFSKIKGKPVVIKPKSTNYGLGITIFKNGIDDISDYEKAVTIALKEDKEIMVEEFISGTEYRFFVLDGKTRAVLLRVPAHVIGDGVSTIKELVEIKNSNLLRGDGLSSPLKKIALGDIELLQLKEQGYTLDTILEKNKIAYLRENSNISTGGDSVDMTDEVHSSYKKVAEEITEAMFAKVCGVDLIIKNINEPINSENYGIIEANFNPMMMMHIFPAKGTSRRLTEDVLKMLFPEKF